LFGATIEPIWLGKKTHYRYFASIDKNVFEVARAAVIYMDVYLMHARKKIRWYGNKVKLELCGVIKSRKTSG
jgi:hypothetical protein